jgi:hypothetical protein
MKKNLFLSLILMLFCSMQVSAYTFYFHPNTWTYAKYAVQSWSTDYDAAVYSDFMTPVAGHEGWFSTSVPDGNNNMFICAYPSEATTPAAGAVDWTYQLSESGTYTYYYNNVGYMEDFDGRLVDGRILSGNILYTVDEDNLTAEVAYDQSAVAPTGELIIPSSITCKKTYTVTSIYAQAYMSSGITSVSLPNTLLHIGDAAFHGSGLTSVTIPSSVTSIDDGAFALCGDLSSVTLEEGLTALATQMFQFDHQIKEIAVPNSITDLPAGVFSYCEGLTSVTLGTGVDTIEHLAFGGSENLLRLTIYAPAPPKVNIEQNPALVSTCSLLVPSSVKAAYEAHDYWKNFTIKGIYIVTFNDKDGNELKTEAVEEGQSATAPDAPAVECYTFSGWDKAFTNVTSDLTVTAQYAVNQYEVKFLDWDGTELKKQTVNCGDEATAPANPTREGYNFTGWDKVFKEITAPLTVTAQYTIKTFTVTFKDSEGKTIGEPQEVEWNTAAEAPKAPEVACQHFTGWDEAFDHVQSDLVVTAQYAINQYEVKFLDWDGAELKKQTVDCGDDAEAPANPSREGYTFTGWDEAYKGITSNLTVTAVYTINKYTVIFKDWDGTTLKTQENVAWNTAATAPEEDPKRDCHTFTGWDKEFSNVKSDLIVTAQYTKNTYTVIFKDWDDVVLETQNDIECGDAAIAPAAPHHTGYTFIGWDKDFIEVTSDLVVIAQFEPGEEADVNILFVDKADQKISNHEVVIRIPAAPEIEGFTFIGWQPVAAIIDGEIKIQAVYQANEPTSAPAVYANPANPAQKLIRNGNVYILQGEKTYTVTGQLVK